MTRLPTNVPGLDLVLNGGLEQGAVEVVAGAPGTGKTIIAQQICFANATAEHKALYYTTLSEPHTKLVRHLEPFSFFDPHALGETVEHVHLGDLLRDARRNGLEPLVSEVVRKALDSEPVIVVIDSAKMLHDFVDETERPPTACPPSTWADSCSSSTTSSNCATSRRGHRSAGP